MTITLLAVSLNDSPLSQPITASFDARGGTIGRADHNTMALPDPERHISRLQAEVMVNGAQYLMKNVGAANPITVAGRQIAAGESAPLANRDEVRIGGYLLRVIDDASADSGGARITQGRALVNDSLAGHSTSPGVHPPQSAANPAATLAVTPNRATAASPLADFAASRTAASALPDLAAPLSSHNPFAELLAPPQGLPANSAALARTPVPAAAKMLPDDYDPFATGNRLPTAPAAPAAPSDPFADLIPVSESASINSMFNLQPGSGADEALARFAANLPVKGGPDRQAGVSTDPLAMFGPGQVRGVDPQAPLANHTPNLHAAFTPPKWPTAVSGLTQPPQVGAAGAAIPIDATWLRPPRAPSAPGVDAPALHRPEPKAPQRGELMYIDPDAALIAEPPPQPLLAPAKAAARALAAPAAPTSPAAPAAPAAPTASSAPTARSAPSAPSASATPSAPASSNDALWQAFCEGAGVHLAAPQGMDAHTMRELGQLLHAAVSGTLQLIAVRASTKQELRAAVTLIQPSANNPLKFSPDARTCLEQLLSPPARGFMSGPAAMTDAMNDLVGHSIGTMAGMRAALDGVLGRFEPERLESKLSTASLLDSVLPMNRRAKLWNLYLQHYGSIRDEAEDDFQSLFGKAFLAAYEEQLARLRLSRPPA